VALESVLESTLGSVLESALETILEIRGGRICTLQRNLDLHT
jgi:hypothetical protein